MKNINNKIIISYPSIHNKYEIGNNLNGLTFYGKTKARLNLYIGKNTTFHNCEIVVYKQTTYGKDDDKVVFGDNCILHNLHIEFHDGNLIIGNDCRLFSGYLVIEEGKSIKIGKRCLFAREIEIRTSDSHTVLNLEGKRINPAQDVLIGDHVWIGKYAKILKGGAINHDSILGYYSLLTKYFYESNVILAGQPAKIVKRDINWNINLIK